jgi:hypothetical protein
MKHERFKFEVDNLHVWIFEFLCIISLIFLFLDCRASLAMTERGCHSRANNTTIVVIVKQAGIQKTLSLPLT